MANDPDELLIELNALPEKTAYAVRLIAILQQAKAKRDRRKARNLKNKANGG